MDHNVSSGTEVRWILRSFAGSLWKDQFSFEFALRLEGCGSLSLELGSLDGAPPHYGNIVREFLDTTFPQRGAVMAWPPLSPDITPFDFYLWGYVKQHVDSERTNDINHLKQRITDVIRSVTPDVLTRVWEELEYPLDVCRAANGAHIELR
ncbi:hypothetical protein AVEN_264727-1 [Araneus ventricosus]|uniref:Tc1-like transposase DDE domain-containing protein n=1 Tax=Araneus ventricosus TaxID=182803 RepID=A0A4Y2NH81_ARAVE|nr:hypothetical protein AVEN_264727-1 [Araneus ventricosus]